MPSKEPDNRPTHGWSQVENLRKAEESIKGELPKPYTVPEGYSPPTMMEQWRYAQRRCRAIILAVLFRIPQMLTKLLLMKHSAGGLQVLHRLRV